jgi:hypothetical protein
MNKRAAKQACKELKEAFQGLNSASGGDDMFITPEMAKMICDVADRVMFLQGIIDNHNKRQSAPTRKPSLLARRTEDIVRAHFPGTANCGPDCCEAR